MLVLVGITWEDAPEVQSAMFGKPYKVRCVVRASPPAGVDWRKDNAPLVSGKNNISVHLVLAFILFVNVAD